MEATGEEDAPTPSRIRVVEGAVPSSLARGITRSIAQITRLSSKSHPNPTAAPPTSRASTTTTTSTHVPGTACTSPTTRQQPTVIWYGQPPPQPAVPGSHFAVQPAHDAGGGGCCGTHVQTLPVDISFDAPHVAAGAPPLVEARISVPIPMLLRDTAAALQGIGVFPHADTLPTRCAVVEAEGGVDISIAHLLGDRVCDTAVCLLYSGDGIDLIFQRRDDSSDGDGVVAGADTGVPEVARLARGSVVVLDAGHEWTVMADTTGAWGAVLYCDFQEAATMTSGTEGGESKTATKRKNRKKEARQQKKLIKEDAKKRAAASTNPKSLAIVPHGCFKSVPIPWEVVEEAHTVVDTRMTPEVEKAHVKDLYNAIAEHWHHTRWKAWPRVTAFVESLPNSSLVGDIGCGNGKNIPACTSVGMGLGCDLSHELVKICRARGFEVAVADAMTLPYRDEVFDATLSIAVMHHLSSPLRRIRAIAELTRVLKTGGQALIYAWAYEQKNAKSGHKFGSQDVFVPWQTRETTRVTGPESTESNAAADASTTSTPTEVAPVNTTTGGLDGEVLQRYCHVYKDGELQALIGELPWLKVIAAEYDTGNWSIRIEKTAPIPPDYDARFNALCTTPH
eukprot:m.60952 g.60952  ORF g.60952 m.60952 type:complete len:621 (-) comp17506_c0_seq1:7-1869(-)